MTFKVRLLLGAAAPFVFTLPAVAQVTISTATTTPVQTATANNGAASDITIESAGSIAPTTANTTAVTVNSSNDVVNNGAITFNNLDNTVAVLLQPGVTGSYSGSGTISLLEDYNRVDTDSDTDPENGRVDTDGPLAEGNNRIGILLAPGGTFTGDIRIDATNNTATLKGGSINVEGNNSAGVSLQSDLAGSYVQNGFVTVTGTNAVGVDIRGDVSGNVQIGSEAVTSGTAGVPAATPVGGGVSVRGENAVAVRVLGDVSGEFMIDGAISATGFAQAGRSNYQDPDHPLYDDNDTGADEPDALDPDDLLPGGPAVEIRGDLARGFLVNGAAIGVPDTTPDVKDAVQNFDENRTNGSISSQGSGPAVLIQAQDGAAGDALVLSRVRETIIDNLDDDNDDNLTEVIAVFDYDYGFMNRGGITADGVNVGFDATGVRIAGSADGTHTTTVEGGIFNGGSIAATSFEANASALVIGAGASTPQIVNNGSIVGIANTETNHAANAVRIEAGADVGSVTNNGLIFTSVDSYNGDAIAFQDLSGSVDTFTNSSRITAGFVDDDTTDNITDGPGRIIALDLSHNAGAVHLTQNDTIDNARILGDVLLGAGSDRFDLLSGEVIGDVDFGAGSDTFVVNSATLSGNATFGGAGATVNFNGGQMTGDLALGNAAGSLTFANNSTYVGAITRTGAGAMSLAVDNSTVNNLATGTLNLSSMALSNNARIGIGIDNARIAGNIPNFNITGVADIAANTEFRPVFDQFTNQTFTLRVLNAGTLNLGGPLSGMIADDGPFLYNMQLVQPNPNAIDLVLEVKDAQELGLNTRQAGAYDAVLALLEEEDQIASALTSLGTANEFQRSWADMLPANDASILRVLATNASAAFGATANRLDMVSRKPDAPGGAWTEEFGVYHSADANADSVGISGGGFGVAAGVDLISTGTALVGAFLSLESAEMEEERRSTAPLNVAQTAIGAYAGWVNGNLAINGAASYGFINFTSDREVIIGSLADRLKGEWKGQSYSVSGRATYTVPMGWLDVKPYIGADYTGFTQDGYQESSTTVEGLEIIAGDSDASLATASYGVQLIGNLGGDAAFSIRPELSAGYRSILNWEATPAELAFAGGPAGSTFTLNPGVEPEDAITAGLGLNIDSQFVNIKLGYDTEISDTATTHYGSITLRMAFW